MSRRPPTNHLIVSDSCPECGDGILLLIRLPSSEVLVTCTTCNVCWPNISDAIKGENAIHDEDVPEYVEARPANRADLAGVDLKGSVIREGVW